MKTPAAPAAPARLALVIGNAAYENARPLRNPVHDAQDMCEKLRRVGFVTLCRFNVGTRAEMAALVDEYAGKLGPATVGVVFYAGHGVQVGIANYLVPTQDPRVNSSTHPLAALYGVNALFDRLRDSPARLNIVMLDACRTELFEDGAPPAAGRSAGGKAATQTAPASRLMRELQALPGAGSGLVSILDAPPRTVVFYATAAKAAAFDGDGRNGPLTKHILRHIETRDQTLGDFFDQVTKDVEAETLRLFGKRQAPFTYRSSIGKFCFVGCPPENSVVVPPAS